jgi:uncharacterized repeat protein (TIGR01451 family)
VAEYTDSCGRRRITISNRVCLCAPRYAVVRTQTAPLGTTLVVALGGTEAVLGQALLRTRQPSLETQQLVQVEAVRGREKPSEVELGVGTVLYEQLQAGALVVGRIREQTVVGSPIEKPCVPARPLHLCKWADKQAAQIGEVVTFYLKYSNPGGQPISDVAVSDSLIGRLEYVAGSARSDRSAAFTTEPNEAGSVTLRWEMSGSLLPGQSGMVSFQARIR